MGEMDPRVPKPEAWTDRPGQVVWYENQLDIQKGPSTPPVSGPPVASDEQRFVAAYYSVVGDASKGESIRAFVAGGEGALFTDLMADFEEWFLASVGITAWGYLRSGAVSWDGVGQAWVAGWLDARASGKWTRPIPSAAKPSNVRTLCCDADNGFLEVPHACEVRGYRGPAKSGPPAEWEDEQPPRYFGPTGEHPPSKPKDDGKVDWISVTPRSPDAETIHKARAMEAALNSPEFRNWHNDHKNCGECPGDGGNRYCGGLTRWTGDPWPDVKRNPRFLDRTCAEVFLSELAERPRDLPPDYYGKSVVAELLDTQRQMKSVQKMLDSRRQIRDATAEEERRIASLQADLDNHLGKPFTLGPGLALRETVRGCRRCRIRRFGSYCNGCGDPVTSFEMRPGESGW